MKRLLAVVLFHWLFAVAAAAATFDATWNITDFTSEPITNARVWITPIDPYGIPGGGNNIQVATRKTYTNDVNGSLTVSNMLPGFRYRVEFDGRYRTVTITNSFHAGVSGAVNARDYIDYGPAVTGAALESLDQRYVQQSQLAAGAGSNKVVAAGNNLVAITTNVSGSNITYTVSGVPQTNGFGDIVSRNAADFVEHGASGVSLSGTFTGTLAGNATSATAASNATNLNGVPASAYAQTNQPALHDPFLYSKNRLMTPLAAWSPLSFGAVGDGVADDTTPVLAAVAAASLDSSPVRRIDLGGLSYRVTNTLVLTNKDMTLANGHLVTTNQIWLIHMRHDRQTLENLMLGGPVIPTNTSIGVRIDMTNAGNPYIQEPRMVRVKATNFWHIVSAYRPVHLNIENCQLTAAMGTNIVLENADEATVHRTTSGININFQDHIEWNGIVPAWVRSNSVACYIKNGLNVRVSDCDFNYTRQAIIADGVVNLTLLNNNHEQFFGATNTGIYDITNTLNLTVLNCMLNQFNQSPKMSGLVLRRVRFGTTIIQGVLAPGATVGIDIYGQNTDDGSAAMPWIFDTGAITWRKDGGTIRSGSTILNRFAGFDLEPSSSSRFGFGSDGDRTFPRLFNFGNSPYLVAPNNQFEIQNGSFTTQFKVQNGLVTAPFGYKNGPEAQNVTWRHGSGSPEGVITADVGSIFSRTNGGAGSTLYVKESGTGNTGWVAK